MSILVLPGASQSAGVTQRTYYRALADQLGVYFPTTITAGAEGGDPARMLLADEIRDDEEGYDTFGGLYVYVVDGDQAGAQRRILSTGHRGNLGLAILSRPFDDVLDPGTTVEITGPLPVARIGRTKGLKIIVDEALERTLTEARVTFDGTGGRDYDVSDIALVSMNQARGIYDTRQTLISSDVPMPSPLSYDIQANGATRTLVTESIYNADETFSLSLEVQGNQLVKTDGAWGLTSGSALSSDTDEAAVPVGWVVAIGMVKALQHLRTLIGLDRTLSKEEKALHLDDVERRIRIWAPAGADIVKRGFPTPVHGVTDGMVSSEESITYQRDLTSSVVRV